MCDCMNCVNDGLKEHNTKLSVSFCLSRDFSEADMMPLIQTEKITKGGRGKPISVIPTFCPFCGIKYPQKDDGQWAKKAVKS